MRAAFGLSLAVITLQFVCGYRNYTLSRLCSTNHLKIVFDLITDNRPEVLLDAGTQSAAITRQHWNSTNMHKAGATCHFRVDARRLAPPNTERGIYAAVRRMKLRKNPATGACIDFVSFRRDNGLTSGRLCGDYQASDDYNSDESKFFMDESGILWVHVELDEQKPLKSPSDQLEVEIVLTAFEKHCTGPSVSNRTVLCSPGHCIAREFENDGIINCPPQRCSDEDKCVQQVPIFVQQPISGTHIAISAITSLLMTMICVLCVYMCCKCKYDRRAMTPNGASSLAGGSAAGGGGGGGGSGSNRRGPPGQRTVEFQSIDPDAAGGADGAHSAARPMNAGERGAPSAPDLDDKDMPPTYESLFKKEANVISV